MSPITNSNDILQSSPDEKITLKSVEELKKQLWINNIPDEYKNYFEKPLETTKTELLKLRKKYLSKQPNDETIKSFLEAKRNIIIEKSRAWLNQVKEVAWNIQKSMWFEAEKEADWKKDWKKIEKKVNELLWTVKEKSKKLWNNETVKKTKEKLEQAAKKAKEATKKGINTVKKSKWFINFIDSLEKLKKQGWIWGLFATLVLFILWIFGFSKEKLKKKVEGKTKEVLSWKEAKKVREQVIERIKTDILKIDTLDPKLKADLEKILNDPSIISNENLVELQKRLKKNWKLTLLDLQYLLWKKHFKKLQEEIFSPETRKDLKARVEKIIVDKIYKTYNLDLRQDKRKQLDKLVWKYININNFFELQKKLRWNGANIADLLWVVFSQWWDIALFMIEAVSKWIIWPWKLMIYAGKKSTEAISLWLAWLWMKSDISFDKFKEEVDNMNSVERGLLLWTLYRHTWFLSTILWEIAWASSKLLIEWMSSTPVSSFWAWWSAFSNNLDKKTQVFNKLESIFWKKVWSELIKDSLNEIKTLKTNNEIIKLLNKSNNNITTFKKLLSWLDKSKYNEELINNIKNIDATHFPEFREKIAIKISSLKNVWISTNLKNTLSQLHFPIEKFEYEFYKNTDDILKYQREAIKSWTFAKAWKFFTKLWEIQWYSNLSRDLEKLHFEKLSKSQALNKMQALKKLFLDFPEFSRSFFWTVPEIAFVWLALTWKKEDETFTETMLDTMKYMIPIVWPIKMILSAKVSLNKEWIKWYNVTEWAAWVALLWVDASFVWKTILSWWSGTEKVLKIWSHILKPITSSYKFWRDSYKMWKNLFDVVNAEWKINWWELSSKSIEIIKKWFKTKKRIWIIIALLVAWWYVTHEIFKDDIWDEYKKLMEKWIIDNQWNIKNYEKLKKEFNNMDLDEKEAMIEIIFLMARVPTSWLEFKINNDKLDIISHENSIQSDWILRDNEWKILKTLDMIWFSAKNINFKYEKKS